MNKETEIKYLGQDDIRDFIIKKYYKINKLHQRIDELQQRIDQAIEYIENLDKNAFETNDDVIVLDNYLNDLLNILKGSEE